MTNFTQLAFGCFSALRSREINENDVVVLQNPESIIYLDLSNTQVENLDFLNRFPNLRFLGLSQTRVVNVRPIVNLHNLQVLILTENQQIPQESIDSLVESLPDTLIAVGTFPYLVIQPLRDVRHSDEIPIAPPPLVRQYGRVENPLANAVIEGNPTVEYLISLYTESNTNNENNENVIVN